MTRAVLIGAVYLFLFPGSVLADETIFRAPDEELSWWQRQLNSRAWLRELTREKYQFGKSYALVVGIDDFTHFKELHSAKKDAVDMADFAIRSGFDEVVLLTDRSASRERIDAHIRRLESTVSSNDRFLLFWAGHGAVPDDDTSFNNAFLPLSDTNTNGKGEKVSMDEFKIWAQRLNARHSLFLLDACFSGKAVETRASPVTTERLSLPSHQIFTSSSESGVSFGYRDGSGGFFTRAFLRAAGAYGDFSADSNGDGYITLSEIEPFVKESLDQAAGSFQFIQSPQRSSFGRTGGEFFFVSSVEPRVGSGATHPRIVVESRGTEEEGVAEQVSCDLLREPYFTFDQLDAWPDWVYPCINLIRDVELGALDDWSLRHIKKFVQCQPHLDLTLKVLERVVPFPQCKTDIDGQAEWTLIDSIRTEHLLDLADLLRERGVDPIELLKSRRESGTTSPEL